MFYVATLSVATIIQRQWYIHEGVWGIGGMILTCENRRTRTENCPRALCAPDVPHKLTWDRDPASAMRRLRLTAWVWPCHGSGGYSPASHRGSPGSITGQSMWDLWWTKWHWDRFSPVNFIPPVLHYLEKWKKLIIFLFIFITGLHNKPQGCGGSVVSAAGPFLKKLPESWHG